MLRILLVGIMTLTCLSPVLVHAGDHPPPPLQLPDTTPPGKPHFDSKGAMAGDQLPNFPMRSLDGKKLPLEKAWADGTTLLLTSSYTCPKSRSTYPLAAELAKRVASHGIHAAVIYIIEAHPAGDPSPYTGKEEVTDENRRDKILCRQPTTMDERLKLANDFSAKLKVDLPIYVDEMDNAAWATLGGGPNMGVLVDKNGIVLARQGWFDARSMEAAIDVFIARAPKPPATEPAGSSSDIDYTLGEMIRSNKAAELKALLDRQPELERHQLYPYPGSESLLQVACERDQLDIVKLLVGRGADVNAQSHDIAAPLHLVASRGKVETAQFLIEHGADVNAHAFGYGPTPVQLALFDGNNEMAAMLIKAGAKPSFFTAAALGNLEMIQDDFLHDPTVLSRPDGVGRSALVYAVKAGKGDAVKLLLSLGARDTGNKPPRETTPYIGETSAVCIAVGKKDLDLTRKLLTHGSNPNQLTAAIDPDIPADFVRAMLDRKADPNFSRPDELQPLLRAVLDDRRDILQMLLDAGADINVKSNVSNMLFCGGTFWVGDSALHVAIENGHGDLVGFLLDHGAKVDARDHHGATPLLTAAGQGADDSAATVRLLIDHHADVGALDENGQSSIHWAAANAGSDAANVMQVLIDHHANVNAADARAITPLHLAAANSGKAALDIVRLLIDHHANINAADKAGMTPLDYVEQSNPLFVDEINAKESITDLLKKHGAVKGKQAAP